VSWNQFAEPATRSDGKPRLALVRLKEPVYLVIRGYRYTRAPMRGPASGQAARDRRFRKPNY